MKLTLEQQSYARSVTIEVGSDDLAIGEVWEDLIKPALLALGYHPKTVDELVGEDADAPHYQQDDEGERMRRYHARCLAKPYVSGEEDKEDGSRFPDCRAGGEEPGE